MAVKIPNGSAQISYGSALPATAISSDGALFYKTDSIGGQQGLYVYSFIRDTDPATLGYQTALGWVPAVSDLYVFRSGDTMTGPLGVPNYLRLTQSSAASRMLIGNQDAGGANKPGIIEGLNGIVFIGYGSTWTTNGGTLVNNLAIDASTNAGLIFRGNQVWHAGNDGGGSGLDADLLNGQNSAFYQNAGNISAGILPVSRGGTNTNSIVAGGIAFGASSVALGYTALGTSGQVLVSAGTGTPLWTNQSALAPAWTNITGRPVFFYDLGSTGAISPGPATFPLSTISGFESVSTSDMGATQVGITVIGSGTNGSRSMQLAANYGVSEAAPTGLRFRVNDTAGTTTAWGAFRTLWDSGNLTAATQLGGFMSTGGAISGSVTVTGNITASGDVSAGSDIRLKSNITKITGALDKLEKINGVTFTRIADESRGTGLVAQELFEVLPEAVQIDSAGMMSIAYGNVVGLLVEAIKDLKAEIAELRK